MFLTWITDGWRFRQDGPAGGGVPASDAGASAEAASTTEPGEETTSEETGDVQDEAIESTDEGAEETVEGEVDEQGNPKPAAAKPAATKPEKLVPLSAVQKLRDELKAVKQQIDQQRPPEKDPVDVFIESLPKNVDPESEEGKEILDLKAVAPLLKKFRPHLFPKEKFFDQAIAVTAQSMDRIKFMLEQLVEAMPEEQRPAGIKALDKIDAYRKDTFEKSGRRELPTHKDAFAAIMEQAEAEAAAGTASEAATRTDERRRTLSEVMTRRAASQAGGPGNARPVPRRAPPGKRTFDQLEKAGGDFRLP